MKIGIFDSGLGGLVITKAIFKKFPWFNYAYLGDTAFLPYGEKSPGVIKTRTRKAVDFLFKQNCSLVIIACNTSTAWALREVQQNYLLNKYPDRRILGVIIPTLEEIAQNKKIDSIGVIATKSTVQSHKYKKELEKLTSNPKIYELAAPELVDLIENNSLLKAESAIKYYTESLKNKKVKAIIFGCTHYALLKKSARKFAGSSVKIISQDEIIPKKLGQYLQKHKEISKTLGRGGNKDFCVTKKGKNFEAVAKFLFGKKIDFRQIKI